MTRRPDDIWQGATTSEAAAATEDQPDDRGQFADLPAELSRDKSYTIFLEQLKDHLYREESLKLWQCEADGRHLSSQANKKATSATGSHRCCSKELATQRKRT